LVALPRSVRTTSLSPSWLVERQSPVWSHSRPPAPGAREFLLSTSLLGQSKCKGAPPGEPGVELLRAAYLLSFGPAPSSGWCEAGLKHRAPADRASVKAVPSSSRPAVTRNRFRKNSVYSALFRTKSRDFARFRARVAALRTRRFGVRVKWSSEGSGDPQRLAWP